LTHCCEDALGKVTVRRDAPGDETELLQPSPAQHPMNASRPSVFLWLPIGSATKFVDIMALRRFLSRTLAFKT